MLARILAPDGFIIGVVLLIVLFFGARKLPGLARAFGGASHEFKKGVADGDEGTTTVVTSKTTRADAALGLRPVITHVVFHHRAD